MAPWHPPHGNGVVPSLVNGGRDAGDTRPLAPPPSPDPPALSGPGHPVPAAPTSSPPRASPPNPCSPGGLYRSVTRGRSPSLEASQSTGTRETRGKPARPGGLSEESPEALGSASWPRHAAFHSGLLGRHPQRHPCSGPCEQRAGPPRSMPPMGLGGRRPSSPSQPPTLRRNPWRGNIPRNPRTGKDPAEMTRGPRARRERGRVIRTPAPPTHPSPCPGLQASPGPQPHPREGRSTPANTTADPSCLHCRPRPDPLLSPMALELRTRARCGPAGHMYDTGGSSRVGTGVDRLNLQASDHGTGSHGSAARRLGGRDEAELLLVSGEHRAVLPRGSLAPAGGVLQSAESRVSTLSSSESPEGHLPGTWAESGRGPLICRTLNCEWTRTRLGLRGMWPSHPKDRVWKCSTSLSIKGSHLSGTGPCLPCPRSGSRGSAGTRDPRAAGSESFCPLRGVGSICHPPRVSGSVRLWKSGVDSCGDGQG
ncbi:vegetative cell wall protein gp1-like isoform X1 [Ornithorhynchus anatinus]|uniref:vegetative cell wall protein gp1-like isoform X1 n=1 Tax=Ornithorhynchus anatinus TaxID=9258 RepID=UPI0010A92190|nr:vegetative cell wall protein gp1-like isoform X1 [Ornithorhynchus anatinus]XP_028927422.1 vegetative cell wall protein gp1-like isoform X1 [Ornithorhynchus anatinus]XP_028927423.1 vegetative cell wall protein gp1-like isoform X1 [Ornithorhynchus anatinus]XP_028927424.1 vegetative cell wall protein gp1-like isoform X1 [Ornithorhynchus anatinus]